MGERFGGGGNIWGNIWGLRKVKDSGRMKAIVVAEAALETAEIRALEMAWVVVAVTAMSAEVMTAVLKSVA